MRSLENKPNVVAPDADFPFGRIKDKVGSNPGTPVNEVVYGDIHQFFEKLMAEAGVTANELPESEYSGFQLFHALQGAVPRKIVRQFTSEGDGDEVVITQAQLESAVDEGKIFSKGSYSETSENPFVDFQIEVWAFELNTAGRWERIDMGASGNKVEIVASSGNIILTLGSFVVSPAITIRVVFIG